MKVLMINGSPRPKGNTYTALHEMEEIFRQEGVEVEMLQVGNQAVRGCIGCRKCGAAWPAAGAERRGAASLTIW